MTKQNFLTKLWNETPSVKPRQSKQTGTKQKGTTKEPTLKPKQSQQPVCELCGRKLESANHHWCKLCRKYHKLYPEPCNSCGGYFHFAPGITQIDDLAHLAMIADSERYQREKKGTKRYEPDPMPF